MSHLEHTHIVELIREGTLEAASSALMDQANRAARAVPWHPVGTRVDWEKLGTRVDVHLDEGASALGRTVLGACPKLIFMFNSESGVVGATATVWEHLDEISRRAPGQRHVFGINDDGSLDPDTVSVFCEGGDLVLSTLLASTADPLSKPEWH